MHGKKNLSDVRANTFDVPSFQKISVIISAGNQAATDYADDGEDEGEDELEDANPVDGLLERDPEEGLDDTHDGAAKANLTLIQRQMDAINRTQSVLIRIKLRLSHQKT